MCSVILNVIDFIFVLYRFEKSGDMEKTDVFMDRSEKCTLRYTYRQVDMSAKPSYEDLEKAVSLLRTETKKLRNELDSVKAEKSTGKSEKTGSDIEALYEILPDLLFTHDMSGLFLENNSFFTSAMGFSQEYIKKTRVQDIMPEKLRPGFDDYLKRILQNGQDSGTMIVIASDGSRKIVEYNNILVKKPDKDPYVLGFARDITNLLNTEFALKQSEQKFKSILESIYEGYYEVDLTGNFTFVNKAICTILGYDESELIGMNNRAFMDEYNAEKAFKGYNSVFETGSPVGGIALNLISKDEQIRNVIVSVSLIAGKDQKPAGFRGIARDVTENKKLESDIRTFRKDASNAREVTILGLAKLSEYRDDDAGSHLERIREFSKILAEELAAHHKYKGYITKKYIDDIYLSSILHDIGKVGIPDAVLLKPGKLTIEEFEIIKSHSTLGGDALKEIESKIEGESFLSLAKEIAYYHHEKWNGKGYPKGLKGTEIPLSARIIALADVYDALTSKRVYKDAFSHVEAIKIIVAERGQQFDPDVVDAFMARNKEFSAIRQKLEDSELENLVMQLNRAQPE